MSVQASRPLALCVATLVCVFGASCDTSGGAGGTVSQAGASSGASQPGGGVDPKAVIAAVKQATLIFDGTVLPPDSSPVVGAMAVRVGRVLQAPRILGDLTGRKVSVVRTPNENLGPNDRAVFFAYGLSAGNGLVVKEVYRIKVGSDSASFAIQPFIAAADSVLADSTILKTSQQSDAVVLVRVDSVFPVSVPDSIAALGSENAPRWATAVGHVLTSFRAGDSAVVNQSVRILFASGENLFSENPPELHINETWILWLIRSSRLSFSLRPGIDTTENKYFILGPDNVRPPTDSARVANLLAPATGRGRGRGGPP